MVDPCAENLPKVIDNALILKCIKDQRPKGEAGRLVLEEGIPFDELDEIRFEHLNILKIDHLWVLPALTKLSLTHNYIEKIENLGCLVNLKKLNLSFNKIKKIENLEDLIHLEELSLYNNLITVLENMEKLKNLMIFSVGNNLIEDKDQLLYLRKFKNLKSVNLKGNPCAESNDFRIFVAAFLPQIKYYEYKLITPQEIDEGNEKFARKLLNLITEETNERLIIEKKEKELADAEFYASSFVENLNTSYLFDEMFEGDPEAQTLLELNDEVKDLYVEYQEQFTDLCRQVFEMGQEQYKLRQNELDEFTACVDEAKKTNQSMSIEQMEIFIEKRNECLNIIKTAQNSLNGKKMSTEKYVELIDEQREIYNKLLHETWKILMRREMQLYEQMEDINTTIGLTITEMTNYFIESSQAIFSQIRALEVTYQENVGECANQILTKINLGEEHPMSKSLAKIMYDKETLHNAIATSHDIHMQLIDIREDTLINRAKQWSEKLLKGLEIDEIKRNRLKVLEVNYFLDTQREEFNQLINNVTLNEIDPELAALLED